ncbi:MAG: hypothetical protein HOP19_28760 [Acidobacteria bacterium]|nr:hypothetical protein [Acidobacteriota bacterium]
MFSKRNFVVLMLALVVSSLTGYAQNAEWKKRVSETIVSGVRPQMVESGESTVELSAAAQGGILDIIERQKNALLGTWDLTITFSDGSKAASTLTVMPGRADGEGSVLHAAEASLLLPNPTTMEQGAWRHNSGLQFVASYRGYAVNEKFDMPFGKIGFRHVITLNTDQVSFTGEAKFEVVDNTGTVVFSDNVKTTGVRQRAVAP